MLVLEKGRIAAEERIRLERPRAVDGEFQAIRTRLLAQLGVHQGGRPHAAPAAERAPLIAFPTGEIVA